MRRKNFGKLTAGLLAAALAAWLAAQKPVDQHRPPPATAGQHRIVHVYDGDTVKLDNGERVRMIGIDTPETHDNAKLRKDIDRRNVNRQIQLAMGQKAADFARSLLEGQEVKVEFDVEQRDRYGRLLAYLYLSDGTFVNEKIIREGYAYPLTIPPNVRHADEFKKWFGEARDAKRGLWQER